MNRKSVIENRSSKIWHLTDAKNGAGLIVTRYDRCPMSDFKISYL
jgi:hypothetical protein